MPGLGVIAGLTSKIASFLSQADSEEEVIENKEEVEGNGKTKDMAKEAGLSSEETGLSGTEAESKNKPLFDKQTGGVDYSQLGDPSQLGAKDIYALQEKIGAKPDGEWGPNSRRALNTHYATQGIEPPNAKNLQGVLEGMGAEIKLQPDNKDTIGGKKPAYKTNELSSGGDVSPLLVSTVEKVFPGLNIQGLRVTAGNDAYHQGDRYNKGRVRNSAHKDGKAMDFTTTDPEAVRKTLLSKGYTKHTNEDGYIWYKSPDGTHRFLDEYARESAKSTGPHFDFKVY